jgi:flagella basal body P-ring formation protein FlgA
MNVERRWLRGAARRAAALVALTCGFAHAQGSADPAGVASAAPDPTADVIRMLVERELGATHRVEVKVGQLDPRLRLSACTRVEPYLPPGARLWGRTSIGVRCVEGASWAAMLPVTVSVYGKTLITITPLVAGAPLSVADFRIDDVDLTRESGPLVTDPAQLAGKVLNRNLPAGQPLRADALRVPATVSAGDPIKILLIGQGFTIASEGVALAPAGEGQLLRVRTEAGRVVAGTVRDRTIELRI